MVALKKYGMLLFAMVWLPALLLTAADLQGKNLQDSVTVGLALSGGGARGLAHVGVLMALEEEGIPIDMIAGSSMGSIVGGLYAAGYSGEQQQAVLKKINWEQIFREEPETESQWLSKRYGIYPPVLRLRFDFWKIHVPSGLSNAQRISEEFFELTAAADYRAGMNFDSLRVPYRAVAVDLMSGKEIVVDHGSLAQTMRASMSVPLFFQPAELDGRVYVDGGVLNNLPTDVLSDMGADVIIASDVVHVEHLEAKPAHLIEVADRTIDIMSNAMTEKQLDLANVTITPEVQDFHSTQFSRYDSLVVLGYHAAKEQIDTIKQVLRSRHGDRIITRHSLPPGALNSAILGTIQLHGTDYVREAVIRSEIQMSPGDTFSTEKAVNSIQNIYATGLFEYVWAQVSHPGDNQVDMHFHVKEKYPRTINFGTNYISDHGVSGFVQIVHFNFLGWGERFMPILRLGKTKRKLGIEVYNDRLFSTPVTLNNAIYYKEENPYLYSTDGTVETQITLERTAAQFGLGAQFRKNSLITLGIQRERVWIQDAGRYFSGSRTDDFVNLYGKIIFDSTNDPHLPTQGTSLQLEVSHTETIDERVSRYYRAKGILKRYWKFSGKWSASGKVKVAATENSAPFYQYFRIGGPQDLPGFHRDELWGSSLVALGLHPRYKVTGTLYLEANFMAGNIYNSLTQVTMRNLIPAVSAGVRISLPVGPIQLHYGYNDLGRGIWYSSAGFHF